MKTPAPAPHFGATNPSPAEREAMPVKRYASVIGLHPEKEQYYRELHADVWPAILDRLRKSHIRNYSIFVTEIEGRKVLFSYLEYVGKDYEADMRAIAEDPQTQRWWHETDPCQIPLPSRQEGARWTDLEMVFLME